MGIPTDRYITLGFAWGGGIVGIGGAMYAALNRPFDADRPSICSELILQFAIIMVGGLGQPPRAR